jgi:hypothetical protein
VRQTAIMVRVELAATAYSHAAAGTGRGRR